METHLAMACSTPVMIQEVPENRQHRQPSQKTQRLGTNLAVSHF